MTTRTVAINTPISIWVPPSQDAGIPACYNGIPLDVLHQWASEFSGEDISKEQAVEYIVEDISSVVGSRIEFPGGPDIPLSHKGALLLGVLLEMGLVKEIPMAS